jgi:hypothetical protein
LLLMPPSRAMQNTRSIAQLLNRISWAQNLMVAFALLALASVPICLLALSGMEGELSAVVLGRVIRELWPLAFLPGVGFVLTWRWQVRLRKRLKETDNTVDAQRLPQP